MIRWKKSADGFSIPPSVRTADEVRGQVEIAEQPLGSCGLVTGDAHEEAELPQLLQAGASVRVHVVLVEVLWEVSLLAAKPLGREVEPGPEVLEVCR